MMEMFPPEDKRNRMCIQRKLALYRDQEIAGNPRVELFGRVSSDF